MLYSVFVNVATVLLGGTLGLLFRRFLSKRLTDTILSGLGLITIYIGVSGALKGENTMVLVLSTIIGCVLGTLMRLDDRLNGLGEKLEKRFKRKDGGVSIAEGFVSASLLFCVGAMTIVGSLQAGLTGDHTMLLTKSMLDLVSSAVFAAALGIGVLFSAAFVLVFQGGIVLLAQLAAPFLSEMVIAEMTCVGSVLIIGLGLNILGVTKIKTMDFLPAIFLPILLCRFL